MDEAFRIRRYDVAGRPMVARVANAAPADADHVVLVHGLIVSGRYMVPTLRALASDFRVAAPDLPGFGMSYGAREIFDIPQLTDWLRRWMDAAGIARAALLGNSLGCQIAVEMAVRHPERVTRLVLTGPTYDPAGRSAVRQVFRWLADCLVERPSLLAICLADFWIAGLRRGLATFQHSLRHHVEERLPQVTAPALVIRGARDPIVPRDWAVDAARLLPRGRFAEVAGPHCVNYSSVPALMEVVRPFLRESVP